MANPYDKFLNTGNITNDNTISNPYDQYLNSGDRNQSLFSTSTEDPPVDYTKPLELPEEKNPYLKFVNTGEFGTGTEEDISLSKKIGNEDTNLVFDVSASDVDNNSLTFSCNNSTHLTCNVNNAYGFEI